MQVDDEHAFVQAIARQDRAALATFEQRWIAQIPRMLSAMKLSEDALDEVMQRTRERLLLVGDDGHCRLESYAGQGRLAGLVRVTATRIALDLCRARRPESELEASDASVAFDQWVHAAEDPATRRVRVEAKAAFRLAFAEAAASLAPRERAVLRMHVLRGVTFERIAESYGVHRATAVRWVAAAKELLHVRTRAQLSRTLGLASAELDELLSTQLDASVERVFATQHE
ncbi:MAG: sigma factor-like helix-turn-helix DNA-binding protein [Deltaproteobacteria bacterium]|nr:sigma factor-like helix-turn-helix DNA-binding protein [Deltaproteobacteria bacterium]